MSKFKPKDFEQRVSVPCAHTNCPNEAITVQNMQTGLAYLCKSHYLFHVQQQADDFCRANGLTSRAAQQEFIRTRLGKGILRHMREPGEEG